MAALKEADHGNWLTLMRAERFSQFLANLAAPCASIEGIEYHASRKLDKAEIQ